MAEILKQVSYDSVNRFLLQERYEARDLFETLKPYFNLVGGFLSVDHTVIEKTYSDVNQAELISYYWSGKYHQTIKGINLITMYHCTVGKRHQENHINKSVSFEASFFNILASFFTVNATFI